MLLEGESGSGKQTLAEHLHQLSAAREQFVRMICRHGRRNRVGEAKAGTLFLKHIHLLSAELQKRILVELADRNGGLPRLVASADEMLERLVSKGDFMPELFYRLVAYRVCVPPLRQRVQDIPELFSRMLLEFQAGRSGKVAPPPPAVMDVLMRYCWPGNLRELQNTVRRYLLAPQAAELAEEIGMRMAVHGGATGEEPQLPLQEQVRRAARKLETNIILRGLERYRWNRRRTAQGLKISYRSLLYEMKDCNIRVQPQAAADGGGSQ